MDAAHPALLPAIKQRLSWLGQRQEVLARNIANADTPGYRPRDLEAMDLKRHARPPRSSFAMAATSAAHLSGRQRHVGAFAERIERDTYETAPAGNAVVLEEQMAKLNHTAISHRLASELYRKHLGMVNTAVGKR